MFTFNGTSPFITSAAVGYLQTIPATPRWVSMIASYLRLEEFPIVKGVSVALFLGFLFILFILTHFSQSRLRLPTESRPSEVSKWMRVRSYEAGHIPFVSDIGSYSKNFILWWTSCQPAWRRDKGWPLPRDDSSAAAHNLNVARGQNGLFLVIISTALWASSIKSERDCVEFNEVVDDIQWVINKTIDSLKVLPAPAPPAPVPAPSDTSLKPGPALGTIWMSRGEGKRRPKPSHRLLEGGGA